MEKRKGIERKKKSFFMHNRRRKQIIRSSLFATLACYIMRLPAANSIFRSIQTIYSLRARTHAYIIFSLDFP